MSVEYDCCVCRKHGYFDPWFEWKGASRWFIEKVTDREQARIAKGAFACFACRRWEGSTSVVRLPAKFLEIRSGGAPGADCGALEAAQRVGATTGGFVPLGYGHPEKARFGLVEHAFSAKHDVKDRANVDASDALVGILQWDSDAEDVKAMTGAGTTKTLSYALDGRYEIPPQRTFRPNWVEGPHELRGRIPILVVFVIDGKLELTEWANVTALFLFLLDHRGKRVMVSGPTEKTLPGIGDAVRDLFLAAFDKIGRPPTETG